MSHALFPEFAPEDQDEMRRTLARPDAAVLVLERDGGQSLAGFVEAGTRSVADGCLSSPIGYVEAWYVDPDARRAGSGRALLKAAEDWARAQGYTEMASDALLDNIVSHEAHKRSGYVEVDRVVIFRKPLV